MMCSVPLFSQQFEVFPSQVSPPEKALAPQKPVRPHPICKIHVYSHRFICETGTDGYMAPESYDHIPREPSADVYSFAIIMYILRYGYRLWTLPHGEREQERDTAYKERGLTAKTNKCNRPPLSDAMVFRDAPVFRIGAEAAPELRKSFIKSSGTRHTQNNHLKWNPERNVWEHTDNKGPLTPWYASPSVKSYVELMYALAARALLFTSLTSAGNNAGMKMRQNDPKWTMLLQH